MTTEPKLPPLKSHFFRTGLGDFSAQMHAYGLQCFEAGRQQGIAEEREQREQQDLHDAITAAKRT